MFNKIFNKIVFSNTPPSNKNVLWIYPIDNKHYDIRMYTVFQENEYTTIKKWVSIGTASGRGDINIQIEQNKGNSTEKVMSQNATTQAIDTLYGELRDTDIRLQSSINKFKEYASIAVNDLSQNVTNNHGQIEILKIDKQDQLKVETVTIDEINTVIPIKDNTRVVVSEPITIDFGLEFQTGDEKYAEIDFTIGDTVPEIYIEFNEGIWIKQPEFKANTRYLICYDNLAEDPLKITAMYAELPIIE